MSGLTGSRKSGPSTATAAQRPPKPQSPSASINPPAAPIESATARNTQAHDEPALPVRTSKPSTGGLVVFENGKEVFRMLPANAEHRLDTRGQNSQDPNKVATLDANDANARLMVKIRKTPTKWLPWTRTTRMPGWFSELSRSILRTRSSLPRNRSCSMRSSGLMESSKTLNQFLAMALYQTPRWPPSDSGTTNHWLWMAEIPHFKPVFLSPPHPRQSEPRECRGQPLRTATSNSKFKGEVFGPAEFHMWIRRYV